MGKLTPIGRELSANAQVDDVQIQFPAMGSQNGVEQLAGTRLGARGYGIHYRSLSHTSATGAVTSGYLLCRVGVAGRGLCLRTPILYGKY